LAAVARPSHRFILACRASKSTSLTHQVTLTLVERWSEFSTCVMVSAHSVHICIQQAI